MKEEVERKHQSDATLRWLTALINEDAKQLVELSLQPDPAGRSAAEKTGAAAVSGIGQIARARSGLSADSASVSVS